MSITKKAFVRKKRELKFPSSHRHQSEKDSRCGNLLCLLRFSVRFPTCHDLHWHQAFKGVVLAEPIQIQAARVLSSSLSQIMSPTHTLVCGVPAASW